MSCAGMQTRRARMPYPVQIFAAWKAPAPAGSSATQAMAAARAAAQNHAATARPPPHQQIRVPHARPSPHCQPLRLVAGSLRHPQHRNEKPPQHPAHAVARCSVAAASRLHHRVLLVDERSPTASSTAARLLARSGASCSAAHVCACCAVDHGVQDGSQLCKHPEDIRACVLAGSRRCTALPCFVCIGQEPAREAADRPGFAICANHLFWRLACGITCATQVHRHTQTGVQLMHSRQRLTCQYLVVKRLAHETKETTASRAALRHGSSKGDVIAGPMIGAVYGPLVWASLLPIVGGVTVAALFESSCSWAGLNAAVACNFSTALRSIYAKQCLQVRAWPLQTLRALVQGTC